MSVKNIYFYFPNSKLTQKSPELIWEEIIDRKNFSGGCLNWTCQTYVQLLARGYPVKLTSELVPGSLNVLHYDHLSRKMCFSDSFLCVSRADRPRPFPANTVIVQNRNCVLDSARDKFIPHWPQPGLAPRDKKRSPVIKTVGYFGKQIYANHEIYSDETKSKLALIGVDLKLYTDPKQWSSYKNVDAVLAVRSASHWDRGIKPASKLVNAWHAGCVPILGNEPAFRDAGSPEDDYIEVENSNELIDWIKKINSNPQLFQKIIDAGMEKSKKFTDDAVSEAWSASLWGPIWEKYEKWKNRPDWYRKTQLVINTPVNIVKRKLATREFRNNI